MVSSMMAGFAPEHQAVLAERCKTLPLPDASTLQRYMFYCDVGFMTFWAKRSRARECALYVMTDASPQFKRNLLVSHVDCIALEDLPDAIHAFNKLIALGQKRCAGHLTEHEVHEGMDASSTIAKHFQHHSLIPISCGKGAMSLSHKFRGLMHQLWVESESINDLLATCSNIVSFCTDLGTESGLSQMPAVPLRYAIPHMGLQFDEEEGGDAFDSNVNFPNSMLVPGLMHILSNLLHDMVWSLIHFQEWYDMVRCLTLFLHDPTTRERMHHLLIRGTPWQKEAENKLSSSCPLITKWRWHLVINVLRYLILQRMCSYPRGGEGAFTACTKFKSTGEEEEQALVKIVTDAVRLRVVLEL